MSSPIELQALPPAALRFNTLDAPSRPASPAGSSLHRSTSASPDRLSLNPTGGSHLAPVDRGKDAWIFLACATTAELLCWGLPFSVGVLHEYWLTHLFPDVPGAESTLTLAATLQTGLMYLSCFPFSYLLGRFPRHRVLLQILGLICAVTGLVGSAFVTSPSHLLVCLGIIYPVCCVFYLPSALLLFEWFQAKRGLASGVLYAGTGAGGTIFSILTSGLLSRFGYKATMISLGLGFGFLGSVTLCGIKPRIPVTRRSVANGRTHPRSRMSWSFLKASPFYAFTSAVLFISLGNFIPSVFIPTYAAKVGAHPGGSSLISMMNAASIPGLLMMGYLSDKVHVRIVVLLSAGGAALASIFLWGFAGTSSAMLVVFVLAYGCTSLSFTAVWSPMISLIARDDARLPPILFACFAAGRGIGNISSGPIASSLLKSTLFRDGVGGWGVRSGQGAYGALFLFSGLMQLVGALCGIAYRTPKPVKSS